MASPSSVATILDPLGFNSPAGRALMVLRPENEAAKWAFSQVVDFIKEQDAQSDDDDLVTDVRSHYAKFMWFSDEQVYDSAVSRFVNHSTIVESPSSPSSLSSSTCSLEEPCPTMIWTGFYFLDSNIKTLHSDCGWLIGRLSKRGVSFAQPTVDILLTDSRAGNVARRHAVINFSPETRLATVSLEFGNSAVVNATSLTSKGSVAGCALGQNRIHFGDLMYSLEYTSYCLRPQGQTDLSSHLTGIHGDNQPTKEVLQATPTPQTTNVQTIGKYTITGGLTGRGTFGRVRPAVGPDGQKIVAVKTMEARPGRIQYTREKIALMDLIAQRAQAERQHNVLTMIESIHIRGRQVDEFHIVLEPYIGFTLSEIPKDTHYTKHELILHDCLRGLAFLHAHGIVHTDIKPENIGLLDFHKNEMHKPAQLSSYSRPPRTVILDIDSMEQIPRGQAVIKAAPGSNGTVGFHSPEHEMSEYDGRTDVWALGVSLFRAIFGTFPWSYGTEGNPWRKDREVPEARQKFHARYDKAVGKITDHYLTNHDPRLGEPLCDFLIAAFRFPDSEIASQRRSRPTSAECVDMIVKKSELLKERLAMEVGMAAEATATTPETNYTIQSGHTKKRPAPDSHAQPKKREMEYRHQDRHHIVDAISRIDPIDKLGVEKAQIVAE
ncbi:kinase-like domain-containing protein [Trichoderma camerunense]